MNRGNILPFQKIRPGRPATATQTEGPRRLCEVTFEMLIKRGRELTRQTAIAEREGNIRRVERLLREKDQIHRLRKELSDACR